jgi:hypothetical protein
MQRRDIGHAVVLASFVLSVLVAGCGGPSGVAEKRDANAPSHEKATPAAQKVNQPPAVNVVAEPVPTPSAPPKRVELIDSRQLSRVLDLRKVPTPDGSTVGSTSVTKLHVVVPLAVVPAVDFFLGKLEELGWKRTGPKTAESVTEAFAQVSLAKEGCLLTLTAMPGKPKESNLTIEHLGNLDARTLPRIDGAEEQYSTQSSSLYFARGKVAEATGALRRLMKSNGWQEYDQAFSQSANRNDASDLLFRRKGYSVRLFINTPAAQPDKVAVQYSVATLEHDLPAPEDAKNVQIQDSRWILMCEVPRDMAATAEYYRKAMQGIGFMSPPHETPAGKSMSLSFESEDHDLVLVSLKAAGDRATQVKLEGYSAAFREAMKKSEIAAKAKRETEAKAAAKDKAERTKGFEEASKRQDAMINDAIGDALKEAAQPSKPSDLSKKIQADVKAQLDKALKGPGTNDPDDAAK